MTKNSMAKNSLSTDYLRILKELGERIHFARKRRGMTLSALAAGMMSSSKTVQRLEKGDAGISLGVLMAALMCLGLEKDLEKVAAMETDAVALAHDRRRLMDKKRRQVTAEEEFFDSP
jgi:transcriptional regulator with XRE-family HTH domain